MASVARGREEFPNPTYSCYKCADGEWIQMLVTATALLLALAHGTARAMRSVCR